MSVAPKVSYDSTIGVEETYTSYKWSLEKWSYLSQYYITGARSAEFSLSSTLGSTKCVLELNKKDATWTPRNVQIPLSAEVMIKFLDRIKFHTVHARVSFKSAKNETLTRYKIRKYDLFDNAVKSVTLDLHNSLDEKNINQYLQNDTLIIFVEMTIFTAAPATLTRTIDSDKGSSTDFAKQLEAILDSKDFADVIFNVGGKKLRAHKLVLAANNAVFRAMFTVETKEKTADTVDVADADATAFEAFLRYIYTGRVDKLEEIAADLLGIADKYQELRLKNICEKFMMDTVNMDNAVNFLLTANRYSCNELEKRAVDFCRAKVHTLLEQADILAKLAGQPNLISRIFSKY